MEITVAELLKLRADDLDGALLALWWDAQGNWERAHEVAQDVASRDGSWVHAYLHRKEGDVGNARYWYAQAGQPAASGDLKDEWHAIVTEMLGRNR